MDELIRTAAAPFQSFARQYCLVYLAVKRLKAIPPTFHLANWITNAEVYELEGRVFKSQSLRSVFKIPGVKYVLPD